MPATAFTPTVVSFAGVANPTPAATDIVNHNSFSNNGATWLLVNNTDAATQTLTVTSQYGTALDSFLQRTTKVYSLAAAAQRLIGPFPINYWGSTIDLLSSDVDLHVSVLQFG